MPRKTMLGAESLAGRWFRFALAAAVMMVVMFVLAPLPIKHFGPMAHYVEAARQHDIHPGALYYTDVSVSGQAEFNSRDTVRYFHDLPRRQAR